MRDTIIKKYNILFISQSLYLARSLLTHIEHSNFENADIITERKLIGKNINVEYIKSSSLCERINSIYECILPISYCYIGKSNSFIHRFSSGIKSLFRQRILNNLCSFIKNKNYSYIYINSLILHKIISNNYPCIIHVRERYDGSDPTVYDSLCKAKGVVFIDNAVYEPFKHLTLKHTLIINNPIDMVKLNHIDLKVPVDQTKTIFTYIGRIEPDKGISFLIDAFQEANLRDSILLIVGGGDEDYVNCMMNKSVGYHNIIFYGVEDNIQMIYDISDYILRGENQQCVGRTMYEGLYSGCEVIIPGNDLSHVFEGETFKDMIHFYTPCNKDELSELIKKFNGTKISNRIYRSNVKDYMQKFNAFVRECLNET